MKRILGVLVAVTLVVVQLAHAQAQVGVIAGTATGPAGPLAGVTVNIVNAAGQVVGSAVTTATGGFSVGGLAAGTFTVNVVGTTGAVISTTTATLAAGAMTATVTVTATAAALAGAGVAAGGVAAAGAGTAGLSTAAIVGTVAAVGGGIAAATVIATNDDASPSR